MTYDEVRPPIRGFPPGFVVGWLERGARDGGGAAQRLCAATLDA
jgi:hypothetical protein